jgi:hypothetical protein
MNMNSYAIFIVCSAFAVCSAKGAPLDQIALSRTFTIELPGEFQAQMGFMPSFGGLWLEGVHGKKKFSVWIQRKDAPTVANMFSMKRYWEQGVAESKIMGETSEDKGCYSKGKYIFECDRLIHAKKERYASEKLVWNSISDIVVVRVMSATSSQEAEAIAKMIVYRPISRLSASVNGRASKHKLRRVIGE